MERGQTKVLNRNSMPSDALDAPLIPIEGAWVCHRDRPNEIGLVIGPDAEGIKVDFGPQRGRATLRAGEWACGLRPGFAVQDVPLSAARTTLGLGTIVETRTLCDRDQALVHFNASGETRWLPFERLRRVMDPRHRFIRAEQHEHEPAERTALNTMAHALRLWNEATGALDRLDVDPLPHQISLVHRILSSGTSNWLIADDVGLGKTIEVGLLLAALERRSNIRRVLIVVPAGLTQQWKEEMAFKFDSQFRIYSRDFQVTDPKEWPLYERVIVSLDLVKPRSIEDDGSDLSTRFGMLLAAPSWDVVIFDEAHRLSRGESGETTLRYRLARALRERTDALLLLTGTPHQGDSAKFQNLLTLVRPDLDRAIQMIDFNPEIVREIILRNRKIDAVDAEGNFIFRGTLVRRVEVPPTPETQELERLLTDYLRRGYSAGERIGGSRGRAVGFVMTIYRKLASSSVFALAAALRKRQLRLAAQRDEESRGQDPSPDETASIVETGEGNDMLADLDVAGTASPFFMDENAMLERIIRHASTCFRTDPKRLELEKTVRDLVRAKGEKLLIFTEYRQTQRYLDIALNRLGVRTSLIHGGQNLDEKRAAIAAFEDDADVLISTEAGGEGLNLHRRCHVMINYDLPWNPARLTQRIGRLYRYGQKEQVIVINFHARDTIDNEIISGVLERLDRVVRQMSAVNAEFDERYYAEVMGELLERLDVEQLLAEAGQARVQRTDERIDAAIAQARNARSIQDEILAGAERFDLAGWKRLGALSSGHLAKFIIRAAPFVGVEIEADGDDPESFTLRLPAGMKGEFQEFGGRTVIPVTTRRGSRGQSEPTVLLDFANSFVRFLIAAVSAPGFGGGYGILASPEWRGNLAGIFLARFQNDQGQPTGEELIVASREPRGGVRIDNSRVLPLFELPQQTSSAAAPEGIKRMHLADALADHAEVEMARHCTRFLHPNGLTFVAMLEGESVGEA